MSRNVGVTHTKKSKTGGGRTVLPSGSLAELGSPPVDRVLVHGFWVPRPEAPPATPIAIDPFRRR